MLYNGCYICILIFGIPVVFIIKSTVITAYVMKALNDTVEKCLSLYSKRKVCDKLFFQQAVSLTVINTYI